MKRFITDVHTVWLTNLAHHPEFRRMVRGAAMGPRGGVDGGDGDRNDDGPYSTIDQSAAATPGTTSRRGLDGGRDSAAIAASKSQIQSVQPERAFRGAVFYASTSQGAPPLVSGPPTGGEQEHQLGGQAAETPGATTQLAAHNALSFDGVDKIEGGAPPELPPPPIAAPTLAVLASERRRLVAVAASGDGGTRRSLGGGASGGARRRSVAGGGGDAGSWLDMSTRVVRVLRFARPPPPPPPAEADAMDDAGGTADHASEASGTCGAAWMIASFHPYDGTETRVVISDVEVNTLVGEALSGRDPLTMAGPPGPTSGTTGTAMALSSNREEGAGAWTTEGTSVSSRIGTTAADGGQGDGGEGKLLVLRRGVRVPVLGESGDVVGKVLSVVEVRVLPLNFVHFELARMKQCFWDGLERHGVEKKLSRAMQCV